jgi:hypothetical protein
MIMRYLLLVLVCFNCAADSFSQTTSNRINRIEIAITKQKHPKKIFAKVLTSPDAMGLDSARVQSIEKSINQSLTFKNGAKPGEYRVTAQFILDKDSILSDVRCVEDPGYRMCEAVLRALKKGGIRWKPAPGEGVKVREYRH